MLNKVSKVILGIAGILATISFLVYRYQPVTATETNTTFQVNVKEALSVSITTPDVWASGNLSYDAGSSSLVSDFLTNKITVSVASNNANGFTASMYAPSTDLHNTSKSTVSLPTLSEGVSQSSFPTNHWGYSLDTTATLNTHTYKTAGEGETYTYSYYPMVNTSATPITIMTGRGTGTQDVYFGAKADVSQASGTYAGTVVISVVSGEMNDNNNSDPATTPSNPSTPNATEGVAQYNSSTNPPNGATTYTYSTSGNDTTTTVTQVSDGNNVDAYAGYTPPQGVTSETNSNSGASPLAIGLATTAVIAAASGASLFVAAKNKKDADEE